jgi:DNA or RNA helicases of superfamily II
MAYDRTKPLIVNKDMTVTAESEHADYERIRHELCRIAELVKLPGRLHTYRISPMSLWNAAAAGMTYERVIQFLQLHSKWDVPAEVCRSIAKIMGRYGLIRLEEHDGELLLVADGTEFAERLADCPSIRSCLKERLGPNLFSVYPESRGKLKRELIREGYPAVDLAGYLRGEPLDIRLAERTADGRPFRLRDYQREAVDAFYDNGSRRGGSGLLVLPCGAGKTVIGIAAMARVGEACLILTSSGTSVRQWKREILDKTNLTEEQVGEYTGDRKEVRPVTIATYQILTHRPSTESDFSHMRLFQERQWGLIIYDEVHLLPAPVFRATAEIQATRRLGLTATLVREDGREEDVFSLVGPKRYDVPWKTLERQGWIAEVVCEEVRVPLPESERMRYLRAPARERHRIAGENPEKLRAVGRLLENHAGMPALVIGQYLRQLKAIAEAFGAPLVSGRMKQDEREEWYRRFREGRLPLLVVSKVANFALDLPDASLAIQVSGSFGSRQEEAQRLGRILRPKSGDNTAYFYTVVSADTREQDDAFRRQMFLLEQGYRYRIRDISGQAGEGRAETHHA